MDKIIDWVSRKTLWLVLVPAFIVVLATAAVPVYLAFQSGDWTVSYEINGSIGDFFGGIMNPIVALLALVWLVKGVRLQQKELEETKTALQASEKHQKAQVEISAISALLQFDLKVIDDLQINCKQLEDFNENLLKEIKKEGEEWSSEIKEKMKVKIKDNNDEKIKINGEIKKLREECIELQKMIRGIHGSLPIMEECQKSQPTP